MIKITISIHRYIKSTLFPNLKSKAFKLKTQILNVKCQYPYPFKDINWITNYNQANKLALD